tara:strand:+ start:118 stop:492 length:375 start_codon:yes stop_codon:yes gene_type:complete
MENEFIPYEQALELKKLGFNRKTFAQYNTHRGDVWELSPNMYNDGQFAGDSGACVAPTFSQSFRWFRENYDLTYSIILKMPRDGNGFKSEIQSGREIFNIGLHSKYEGAEFVCLKKLIEIVKEK